jgi:tRNA(Arg) A34 adenosine deaminase TadA
MIRLKDVKIINHAYKIAEKNKIAYGYTMVSVLADSGRIVSEGINDYNKTHAKQPQNRANNTIPTHAEVKCLARYLVKNKKISDRMTLYIVGLTKSKISNFCISSMPCSSCMQFITDNEVKRIVYVTNDGKFNIKEILFK